MSGRYWTHPPSMWLSIPHYVYGELKSTNFQINQETAFMVSSWLFYKRAIHRNSPLCSGQALTIIGFSNSTKQRACLVALISSKTMWCTSSVSVFAFCWLCKFSANLLSSYQACSVEYSELPLIWTPEMRPPLYWGRFKMSQSMLPSANSPLKWGHPSNQDTLTGLKGGRNKGSPLYSEEWAVVL